MKTNSWKWIAGIGLVVGILFLTGKFPFSVLFSFPTKTYEFRLPETIGSVPWGRYEIGGNPVTMPNCLSERYIKNHWLTEYCRKNNIPFDQCPRCEAIVGEIDLSEVPDLIKPEVQLVKIEVWQEQFGCDYREYTMGAGVYIDGKRIGQSDSRCFSGWKKIAELKDVPQSFKVKIIALGEGWGINAPNRYGIGDTRWVVVYYPSEFDYKGACPAGYYLVPELAKCVVECPPGFESNETAKICYKAEGLPTTSSTTTIPSPSPEPETFDYTPIIIIGASSLAAILLILKKKKVI